MAGSSEIEKKEIGREKDKLPLDDVLYISWDTNLVIDRHDTGYITHKVRGRVNRGRLRHVEFSILSDVEVDFEELNLAVRDLDTGEEIFPEPILIDKKFKRIKVPFKYPVDKDGEFGYEAKYALPGTFKAVGEDYYVHKSLLNKRIVITVEFPPDVRIESVADSIVKSTGGIEVEIPKDKMPKVREDRRAVKWIITDASPVYNYMLKWRTVRVNEK